MKILAIETSCDETALALVECSGGLRAPQFKVRENFVSSQIAIHRPWGGVVPNLAKREHIKNLPHVFQQLAKAEKNILKPDLLAVTVGPGLEPALWAGITFAKELHAQSFPTIPLVGANHLEGHLFSFLLPSGHTSPSTKNIFPAIALIVSGGHTILLRVDSLSKWKILGETLDDAVGEAFDKVAKMMKLPYPGGPEISRLAQKGKRDAIPFPRPMLHARNFDFSYSGLKTSVLYYLRDHPRANHADVAASFEEAAVSVLATKASRAVEEYGAHSILLSGGVAASTHLRALLGAAAKKLGVPLMAPPASFNTDNATMIAAAAYMAHLRKKKYSLVAKGTMTI